MVINERLQLLMFDLTKLRHEILSHEQQNLNYNDLAIVDLNLIEDCKYFDHLLTKAEDYHSYFTEPESIKQEFLDQARECLC